MRLLALLLVFPLFVACGDDGVDTSPPPPEPLDLTRLEDLAPALEDAYEQLNYGEYEQLIHEDYVFRVDPAEIDVLGRAEISAVEDLEAMNSMFSGETGLEPVFDPVTGRPTGEFRVVDPVQSIAMSLAPDTASEWEEMTGGEFEGALRRVFDVDMAVTYAGSTLITQIRGKQVLYVSQGTAPGDTSGDLHWQIRAWEDQGIDSGPGLGALRTPTDAASLSGLKSLYLGGN